MDPQKASETSQQGLALLTQLSEASIWVMGLSFVLGSLFTILLLMTLDVVRQRAHKAEDEIPHDAPE